MRPKTVRSPCLTGPTTTSCVELVVSRQIKVWFCSGNLLRSVATHFLPIGTAGGESNPLQGGNLMVDLPFRFCVCVCAGRVFFSAPGSDTETRMEMIGILAFLFALSLSPYCSLSLSLFMSEKNSLLWTYRKNSLAAR